MKYPVIREGQIGSGRKADIRIRHSSVRRRHGYFMLGKEGLSIRAHAGASLRNGRGNPVKEVLLRDGDEILIGRVRLLLVLNHADADRPMPAHRRRSESRSGFRPESRDDLGDFIPDDPFEDDLFDFSAGSGRPFRENPAPRRGSSPFEVDNLMRGRRQPDSGADDEEMWWFNGRQ